MGDDTTGWWIRVTLVESKESYRAGELLSYPISIITRDLE